MDVFFCFITSRQCDIYINICGSRPCHGDATQASWWMQYISLSFAFYLIEGIQTSDSIDVFGPRKIFCFFDRRQGRQTSERFNSLTNGMDGDVWIRVPLDYGLSIITHACIIQVQQDLFKPRVQGLKVRRKHPVHNKGRLGNFATGVGIESAKHAHRNLWNT